MEISPVNNLFSVLCTLILFGKGIGYASTEFNPNIESKIDETTARLISFFNKSNELLDDDFCIIWDDMKYVFNEIINEGSLKTNLILFGNSQITLGVNIHDYKTVSKELLDTHVNHHAKQLTMLTNMNFNTLAIPDIFNIIGTQYKEKIIPITAYRIAYNMSHVLKAIENNGERKRKKIVIEIGGGFGLGAHIFLNNMPNTCYIIIDIPSTSLVSAYFLIMQNRKVCLFGEFDKWDNKLVDQYDVIMLPPNYLKIFEDNFADACINTASLSEMSPRYIEYYIENISRITKFFYSDNHMELNGKLVHRLFNEKLSQFDVIFNRETPINYTYGWHDYYPFFELLLCKQFPCNKYTQMNSKVENMPRKNPEFEPAKPPSPGVPENASFFE